MNNRLLRRVLPAILLSLLATASLSASCRAADRPVQIIAHRGANKFAPENTIPAIEKAIELGLDFVEMDIRETKDGHFILMHNADVDARTDGTGKVADLTLEEIKKLDAGVKFGEEFRGVRPPTLREALAVMQGKIGGYLDFKAGTADNAGKLLNMIEEFGMEDDVVLYAGYDAMKIFQEKNPRVRIMPSASNADELKLVLASGLKPKVIETSINQMDKDLVKAAHEKHIQIFADLLGPFDNALGLKRAIKLGIDGVQTDHPDVLLEALTHYKKEPKKKKAAANESAPNPLPAFAQ